MQILLNNVKVAVNIRLELRMRETYNLCIKVAEV